MTKGVANMWTLHDRRVRARVALLQALVVTTLTLGALLSTAGPVAAAVRDVRLEAGPHSGIRFSSSGAVLARREITLVSRTTVQTDRRRVVPNRSGIWLRITSGALAGLEVRESMVAYVPGLAGNVAYDPDPRVTFPAGRYLGYAFVADGGLSSTRFATLPSPSSARADRRAVINGRPYVHMASGTWAGTWVPVTRPRGLTAQPIRCEVAPRAQVGASQVLRRVATSEPDVALTFDLGGRLTPALAILERLVVDGVCATIFPTGDAASTMTGRAVMAVVRAHPELFEVGNHTQHHCNLRDGGGGSLCPTTPPSAARIQQELLEAEDVIRDLSGREAAPYWRPPYGAYDTRVRAAAVGVGYSKTVMWDVDTIDWKRVTDGGPRTSEIAAKVVANARGGSIVLMHLGGWHTFDALPSMVARLRAAGLQPTTISDLLD